MAKHAPTIADAFVEDILLYESLCDALVQCGTADGPYSGDTTIRVAGARLRDRTLNFGLLAEDLMSGGGCACCADGEHSIDAQPLYSNGSAIAHPVVTALYRIGASANAISIYDGYGDNGDLDWLPGMWPSELLPMLTDPDVEAFFATQGLSARHKSQVRLLVGASDES